MSQRVLFAGAVLTRPGAATKIDASGFTNFVLSGVGVVGLVGEADGGQPQVLKTFKNGAQAKSYYRSGPLVEAAQIAFQPSADPRIQTGASLVVCVKVNNSIAASQHVASVGGGILNPAGLGVTNQGAAGAVAYTYQVVAQYGSAAGIAGISTTAAVSVSTATGNATLNSTNFNRISWGAVTGAVGYLVYRSASAGSPSSLGLIGGTVSTSFDDTGLAGDGSTAPSVNSTKDAFYAVTKDYGKHTNFINLQVSAGTTSTGRILTIQFVDGGIITNREVSPSLGDAGKFTLLYTGSGASTAGAALGGAGPFNALTAGQKNGATFVVAIDGGGNQTFTVLGAKGYKTGAAATYAAVTASHTMVVRLNGATGADQTITFAGTENTQMKYLTTINNQLIGATALDDGAGQITIQSDQYGTGSSVRVVSADADVLASVGIAVGLGTAGTGSAVNLAAMTATEVVTLVSATLTGSVIAVVGGLLKITSDTTGGSSSVNIVSTTMAGNPFGFTVGVNTGTAGVSAATATITPTGMTTTITGSTSDNLNIVWSNFKSLADVLTAITSTGKYTATALISNANRFDPRNMDNVTAQSIMSSALTLYATKYDVVSWVNTNSQLISATVGTGDNQPATLGLTYCAGGYRGVASNSNFTSALSLMGTLRVNQVVPTVSSDGVQSEVQGSSTVTDSYTMASVFAAADAHSASFSSVTGKSERQTWVGWHLSKASLIAQATTLQSFHTVLTGQQITLPTAADNSIAAATAAGTMSVFPEWAFAVTLAGMRAGAPLGEPLTWKYIRQFGITQTADWSSNPGSTDPDDLNLAGVTVAETVPGKGVRVVKCVTTFSRDNNDAYTEESIVQGWKLIAYTWRTALEDRYVGTRGLFSNVNTVIPYSKVILGQLRDQGQIADSFNGGTRTDGFHDFSLDLSGDVLTVGAVVSPVSGINFALNNIYIVPARISL